MKTIEPEGNVSTCPECGYRDGFHVAFQFEDGSGKGVVILICPACHQQFEIGWPLAVKKTPGKGTQR